MRTWFPFARLVVSIHINSLHLSHEIYLSFLSFYPIVLTIGFFSIGQTIAQESAPPYKGIDVSPFSDSNSYWLRNHGRDRDDPRFAPEQIVEIADNILQYQNTDGGWPKDLDWLEDIPYEGSEKNCEAFTKAQYLR
jgi:hypothetical protein